MPTFHGRKLKVARCRLSVRSLLHVERQVLHIQAVSLTDDEAPLNHIAQLTNVSLPRLLLQGMEEGRGHGIDRMSALPGKLFHKSPRKQRHIPHPLAQGRQGYLKDGKAIEEVFAETSGGNLFAEVAVGGSDEAHIDTGGLGVSHLDVFPRLQNAQELGLKLKRHLAYFVQEESPMVSLFQQSFLVFQSSRERAGPVSEHLALQQLLAERGTVDRHKMLLGPLAAIVDGLGKDFLAGACLAGQQHRHIGGGHLACQSHGLSQRRRFAQDGIERVRSMHTGCLLPVCLSQGFFHGLAHQGDDAVVVVALGDVVESAVFDGLHPVGNVPMGSQQNDFHRRKRFPDGAHQLYPISVGQKHIA